TRSLRARIYRANNLSSQPIDVVYREDAQSHRFVLASEELSHPKTQSYVHDTTVSISHLGKRYKFRLFFKRHKLLPVNQAIMRLANVSMEGDVLVLVCGSKVEIRNLRSDELRAADKAVRQFSQVIAPILRTRRTFPAYISFD
ncbi:hypothetical protein F5879DRAFT_814131, partial [Lentinula edodes]